MANFQYQEVNLHYEVYGSGFPVLLFAPGGMRSAIDFWQHGPWNPIEALQRHFRVIAMDQRNAGTSRAPITAKDNWESYSTDHLRLLDHLRVDRCHLVGGCIGGAFSFSLMRHAPERVAAAVIQQSIGLDQNQSLSTTCLTVGRSIRSSKTRRLQTVRSRPFDLIYTMKILSLAHLKLKSRGARTRS